MKFTKLVSDVELPEKASPTRYINVRANKRIDVCAGEQVRVPTGILVKLSKNETATIKGHNVVKMNVPSGELFITVRNPGEYNISIYPGEALAEILVKKPPVKARAVRKPPVRKTTSFRSQAMLIKDEVE